MTQGRRTSPLQRRLLIVLAALGAKLPKPVASREIELEQGGGALVYEPNLRDPHAAGHRADGCRRHPQVWPEHQRLCSA